MRCQSPARASALTYSSFSSAVRYMPDSGPWPQNGFLAVYGRMLRTAADGLSLPPRERAY